jgi:hypothetical protein
MRFCDVGHEQIVFECAFCPMCESKKEIDRHELYQEALRNTNRELMKIVALAVESQKWDGNNPDEDRWIEFYSKAKEALRNEY